MHGRCLTVSDANVFDLNAHVRNNEHFFKARVYGAQQDVGLGASADIHMALNASIEMKVLYYLRTVEDIVHSIEPEIFIQLYKYLKKDIPASVDVNMSYSLFKYLKKDLYHGFNAKILVRLRKDLKSEDIVGSFSLGSIDLGSTIREISPQTISQTADMTIYELVRGNGITQMGLRLGLVRPTRIRDIDSFTIAQNQGLSVEQLCFTRIH